MDGGLFETVGDILRQNPVLPGEGVAREPETVERVMPARHPDQPAFPEPGIYFGMPEDEYHAINAFSASLAKKLAISTMDAWASSPLNLDREDDDTEFKTLGRAYHVRICEGAEAYAQRYAVALDRADFPDALVTVDQIKAAIVEAGETPKGKRKDDWILQLAGIAPDAQIWDAMVADHAEANAGREMISAKQNRRIEIAAKMIEADPALSQAFRGGHAEVAIFWFDEKTGCPCKAKLDYLKLQAIVDLKSYSNAMGRPVSRAIDFTIASQKHYIAVMLYREAVAAAKRLVREHGAGAIFWSGVGDAPVGLDEWALRLAQQPDAPTCFWVYQQTGPAPVTRGRIHPIGSVATITDGYLQHWKRRYVEATKAYGADPWIDAAPVEETTDENVPMSATDLGSE